MNLWCDIENILIFVDFREFNNHKTGKHESYLHIELLKTLE